MTDYDRIDANKITASIHDIKKAVDVTFALLGLYSNCAAKQQVLSGTYYHMRAMLNRLTERLAEPLTAEQAVRLDKGLGEDDRDDISD